MRARELRQYQYFLTLAQELHFGRAAELSRITQPALSQQIGKLEESMGVKLLHRNHRQVKLTHAGEVLRDGTQQIFQLLEDTTRRMRLVDGLEDYRLTLGLVEYANLAILPQTLSRLQSFYHELKLTRHEMSAPAQIAALQRSQIEVGFGPVTDQQHDLLPADGSISMHRLVTSGWRLLMPDNHPLAQFSQLSLRELCGERIIMPAREVNPPVYDTIHETFRREGMEPHVVYETCQVQTGVQMSRNGLGCMLLADFVLCGRPPGMRSVPLTDLDPLSMHMFWRSNESKPLVLDFVELAMEEASRQDSARKYQEAAIQTASWPLQSYLSGRC
jgi:DNA-binding transcriptional LysR family regulator